MFNWIDADIIWEETRQRGVLIVPRWEVAECFGVELKNSSPGNNLPVFLSLLFSNVKKTNDVPPDGQLMAGGYIASRDIFYLVVASKEYVAPIEGAAYPEIFTEMFQRKRERGENDA